MVKAADEARLPLEGLSDKEVNRLIVETRLSVTGSAVPTPESLAVICEIANRELGLRPYQVQMLSALALIHGYLAEIDTGEGKTLSIALAAAFKA